MRRVRALRLMFLVLAFTGLSSGRAPYIAARIAGEIDPGLADPAGRSPSVAPERSHEEARGEGERSVVRGLRHAPAHTDLRFEAPVTIPLAVASSLLNRTDQVSFGSSVDAILCQPIRAGPLHA